MKTHLQGPKLTNSNSKLGPFIFNWVMALDSCRHKTAHCDTYCYGKHGNYFFGSVKNRMDENYKCSKKSNFVKKMSEQLQELSQAGLKYVRLHATGDFYSDKYFEKWIALARKFPSIIFLAYTRNTDIDFSKAPDNLRLRFSSDPSTVKVNPTATSFAKVTYDLEHGQAQHMQKFEGDSVCQGKCKTCKFCFSTTENVVFPGRFSTKLK